MNFWQDLPTPFLAVAPMADVTDAPFRRMLAKYSRGGGEVAAPFVMWTEFVSADGLSLAPEVGRKKLLADLLYSEAERPIVAQLFSSTEAHMEAAARLCRELGYDGVDINMGCPDRSIENQGCGAAMIKTPDVAAAIIAAAKRGARSGEADGIPVSVKTRLGYNADEVDTWIPALLKTKPAALTVHCRTRKELSKVPARWERLKRIKDLRDEIAPETKLIGNGDVLSPEDAYEKIAHYGVDGAMVGRALFGNPWFFHPTKRLPVHLKALPTKGVNRDTLYEVRELEETREVVSLEERLRVLVEHSQLFAELLPFKNFAIMKKHYKAYVNSFEGAAEFRTALMEAQDVNEVKEITLAFLKSRKNKG